MTFFMIGGFVCIATSVALMITFFIAKGKDDNSLASKIVMWMSMLFGVAGASLLTIEYSFPQVSHPEWFQPTEPPFTEYVTLCVTAQFQIDHEECTILTIDTVDKTTYYVTDVFYRPDYQDNIYETKYISAVNADDELVIKEVTL